MEVGQLPHELDLISLPAAGHLADYHYLFVMAVITVHKMAVIGQTNTISLALQGRLRLHFPSSRNFLGVLDAANI